MPAQLFAIVDTAQDSRLIALVRQSPEHQCLFSGEVLPPLDRVSPYLVKLAPDTPLLQLWRTEGWGKHWGLLITTHADLATLRTHVRQFLQARLPDNRIVLFRFYDPRVFLDFLPTSTPAEQAKWFTQVDEYRVELGADQVRHLRWTDGALHTEDFAFRRGH